MHPVPPPSYSTRKRRAWQEAGAAGLLLLALTVFFFRAQLVQGRILYWGDIGLYFLPMTAFLRDNLRAGLLPLWNPLLLCGTPFVGNPQTWPAYPVSWLLPLVSAGYFLSLTVALHVWLTAWGTFVFLRRAEGVSVQAALLGATVFGFGGQIVSKEQFPNMVQAIAWLPLVLYAVFGLTARWRVRDAVCLGAVLGLQLLAAHAQITLLTLYLAGAYGVRQWMRAPERPALRVALARVALAGTIALGLCAVQVLPTLELYQNAARQKLSFRVVDRFFLPPSQLGNFVLPRLHGLPLAGDFSGRGNFWETCCYVSVGGFALALAGAWGGWRGPSRASVRFWTLTALAGVWMAAGGWGGLYFAAYKLLPGFRSFHDPARCLLWSAWAVSVLAAFGWEQCRRRLPQPQVRRALFAAVLLLVFADLAHFGASFYPLTSPAALARPALPVPADAGAFGAHQARVLSPDSARVWQRFTGHRAYRQDAPGYGPLWMQTLTPNLPMLFSLPDASGYEPLARRDAQQVSGLAVDALRPGASPGQRRRGMAWAGMLSVRTIVFFRAAPPAATIAHTVPVADFTTLPPLGESTDALGKHRGAGESETRVFVCRNALWQPRARLVTAFAAVPTQAAALALLSRPVPAPLGGDREAKTAPTLIAGPVGIASRPGGKTAPALIVADTPDRVVVQADTTIPAVLVLADTLHPGWHVSVDRRPAALLSADGFLRAVALPVPGAHRVVFSYRPVSFLLGAYLSLLALMTLAAFFVYCLRKPQILLPHRQEFVTPGANSLAE